MACWISPKRKAHLNHVSSWFILKTLFLLCWHVYNIQVLKMLTFNKHEFSVPYLPLLTPVQNLIWWAYKCNISVFCDISPILCLNILCRCLVTLTLFLLCKLAENQITLQERKDSHVVGIDPQIPEGELYSKHVLEPLDVPKLSFNIHASF